MLSVLINTHLLMAPGSRDCAFSIALPVHASTLHWRQRQDPKMPTALRKRMPPAHPGTATDGALGEAHVPAFPGGLGIVTEWPATTAMYIVGTHDGGREKAGPAKALPQSHHGKLTRKVHEIEIWGDSRRPGPFMYVDDCLKVT